MHGCAVAELLHSGTGGQSWSQAGLADSYPDECASNGIAFSAAPDGSAWAATGRNGAACAPPLGLLYRYGPSGWQPLPPWPLAQVSALAAVSQDVAYAISDRGVLFRTQDGGTRWTQLLPAPAPAGLVDAVSTTTALAAQDPADAGAILRSDNGGRSWSQIAELPGVVTQLDFWSARDGIAASYQADASSPWQLWATSDGGSTWASYGPLPGGNNDVYGPWMSANGHGLLLTVTGGTPWEAGSGGLGPGPDVDHERRRPELDPWWPAAARPRLPGRPGQLRPLSRVGSRRACPLVRLAGHRHGQFRAAGRGHQRRTAERAPGLRSRGRRAADRSRDRPGLEPELSEQARRRPSCRWPAHHATTGAAGSGRASG